MDGAFFRRDIIELVERHGAEYAIKVPFYPWVGLKEQVQQTYRWERVDDTVSCGEHHVAVTQWGRVFRVVVFRKRVGHATAKNFQLDLFDPADGHYEYSAVVTNKTLSGPLLWAFMCGRGAHEKAYAELKSGFAFDCVPTMKYAANSLWQLISVMAFNLVRGFQALTIAERRGPTRKRRSLYRFESIHTLRYQYLHRAGVIVHPDGLPHSRCRLLAGGRGTLQTARPAPESGVVFVTSRLTIACFCHRRRTSTILSTARSPSRSLVRSMIGTGPLPPCLRGGFRMRAQKGAQCLWRRRSRVGGTRTHSTRRRF